MKLFKSNKDEIIAYMEKKYKEEFEFYHINTQLWNADYVKMIIFSKKMPNNNIIVHKSRKDGSITDNYVAYLLETEVESLVRDFATQVYGECKVYNIPSTIPLPSRLKKSTSVADYVSGVDSEVEFTIFIQKDLENKEEDLEDFRKVLEDNLCVLYFFSIYYVDKDIFPEINKSNYMNYKLKPYSLFDGAFMLNDKYKFTYVRWGDDDDDDGE